MATGAKKLTLRDCNLRLCQIRKWSNYKGLGFNLKTPPTAPYTISVVESNSPASAGGLKINDVILAVNGKDMLKVKYEKLTEAIQKARDKPEPVSLLVMEKRHYDRLKDNKIKVDPKQAKKLETPPTMPDEYANFPQNLPRTCDIRLTQANPSFGFEFVNGENDKGGFVQEVSPNSPADITGLRKSDRILEIDDEFVDDKPSTVSLDRMKAGRAKMGVKLYVMDTHTYKHHKTQGLPLTSSSTSPSAPTYENVSPPRPVTVRGDETDTDEEPSNNTTTAQPIPNPRNSNVLGAIVQPPRYTARDSDDDNQSEPDVKPIKPSDGVSALINAHPVEPTTPGQSSQVKGRKHELRLNGQTTYGFEVAFDPSSEYRHKISSITPGLPADRSGLHVNDKILSVNNKTVQNMDKKEFLGCLRSAKTEDEQNGRPLVLEIINENPISRGSSISSQPVPSTKPAVVEDYPTMRRCTIRPWSKFQNLDFEIDQSSNTFHGYSGHQIRRLKQNSPAERANIRNDDYIIEVDGKNTENYDVEDLRDKVKTTYKNKRKIQLLVIDEDGYQWYKNRKYSIDPNSPKAEVTSHSNPDSPPESDNSRRNSETSYRPDHKHVVTSAGFDMHQSKPSKDNIKYVPSVNQYRDDSDDDDNKTKQPTSSYGKDPAISKDNIKYVRPVNQYRDDSDDDDNKTKQPTSSYGKDSATSKHDQKNQSMHTNAGQSSSYGKPQTSPSNQTGTSLTVTGQNRPLSRGAVDLVSEKRYLRIYNLHVERGELPGFKLETINDKHFIRNLETNYPAEKAGLNENDCIIDVNGKNVERKPNKDVVNLLKYDRIQKGTPHCDVLELFVAPGDRYAVSKNPAKSLQALNEERYYDNLPYGRLNHNGTNDDQSYIIEKFKDLSFEPTEPLPRKCVIRKDSSCEGCGFRIIEKQNYDTPIVVHVEPNSPAKRSGLCEGDHIVSIQSTNVQNIGSFDDMVTDIRRTFEETNQVELVVLTGQAFQILKRRGGSLRDDEFDYESPNTDRIQPRFCKLNLKAHEDDYGLSFRRDNILYIKKVESGSPADIYGIQPGSIVLEINGNDAKYLNANEAKKIVDTSKQNGNLEILIIDLDGYKYATKHAIPLNSHLHLVHKQKGRLPAGNDRSVDKSVYI